MECGLLEHSTSKVRGQSCLRDLSVPENLGQKTGPDRFASVDGHDMYGHLHGAGSGGCLESESAGNPAARCSPRQSGRAEVLGEPAPTRGGLSRLPCRTRRRIAGRRKLVGHGFAQETKTRSVEPLAGR